MAAEPQISVVGRHAMLFDDDASSEYINSKEALIPWNNSLFVDRFDVRHLITTVPPSFRNLRADYYQSGVPEDDSHLYPDLDTDRFGDLVSGDLNEEEDEEVEVTNAGGYRSVPFSYGNSTDSADQKDSTSDLSVADFRPTFPVPGNLLNNLPPTEKVHQIIARTATFVCEQGGQSEFILRVKQGDNPTFGFLMPHHHLYPYFRHLVDHPEVLESNNGTKLADEKNNDAQASGALYLLGSVYGSQEDEDTLVKVEKQPEQRNSCETLAIDKAKSNQSEPMVSSGIETQKNDLVSVDSKHSNVEVTPQNKYTIDHIKPGGASSIKNNGNIASAEPIMNKPLKPTPEMKTAVDWIVEIVLKNGREFEAVLIEQDKKRGSFPFLLLSNPYNPYYLSGLKKAQELRTSGKTSCPKKHGSEEDKNVVGPVKKNELLSQDESDDLDLDTDKKEKFKMVIPKSKKDSQDQLSKKPQPQCRVTMDAAATAAILQAATRGTRLPNLSIFSKTAQPQSLASNRESNDTIPGETELMKQQKLKAERLRKAKMFAAMIKNGGKTLESHEPENSGSVSEKVAEEIKGREGSLTPLEDGKLNETVKFVRNLSNDGDEMKISKNRHYRSRRPGEGEVDDEKSEGDDVEDERLRKRDKSHRSSRHHRDRSKERHKRRRKHSSSKTKDDDNDDGHKRHKHHSSSEEEDKDHKRRHRHDRSDEEENDRHKRRHRQSRGKDKSGKSSRKDGRSLGEEAGLEEGEIRMKSSDLSISVIAGREGSKSPKMEWQESLPPLESTKVPDELRAKIRAMLLATM